MRHIRYLRLYIKPLFKMFVYAASTWLGAFVAITQSWDDKTTLQTLSDKQQLALWLGPTLLTLNTIKSYFSKGADEFDKHKRNLPNA